MEGGASDIEDGKPEDAAPHVWMAQPRTTNMGSESQVKTITDSSPLEMEEGQEWSKDEQRQGTQQQPLPGQAVGGERSATETPGVAKAPPQTTSGARSQAMHRKVFHVEITGQQCAKAQTKCALCALWGARLLADAKSSSFVCNVRCLRRWALNQLAALRTQAPTHERVGGCGDMEMTEGENIPPDVTGAQGESAPVSLNPPTKHACAGCEAEGPTCPCTRCWEVWYCSDECAQRHWCQHQTKCQRGAWCGGCGSDEQAVWCEDCNKVAYCSRECRAQEVRNHSRECDGRWKQAEGAEDTRELRNVARHLARNGGFEPVTAPQESSSGNSQNVSKGGDLSDERASEEGGTGERKTEELKDSIIDLVLSERQREDVWREACPDARKHHEERCVKEAARMEELVAAFRGGSRRSQSVDLAGACLACDYQPSQRRVAWAKGGCFAGGQPWSAHPEVRAEGLGCPSPAMHGTSWAPGVRVFCGRRSRPKSSIDMYNNDVSQESAQKFMK